MATLTAYATSGDGFVRNNGSGSWSTIQSAGTGTVASQFNPAQVVNDGTTADKYIGRGIFSFDLSSIPPNATISSATLSLYVTAVSSGAGGAVGITSATPASTTTLATSDFGLVGSTEYATRINFASLTASAYNNFALNAAGLTYLTGKIGTTAGFAVRGSFDIDNSAPGTTVYSDCNISTSEQSGTSQDPTLTVVYTVPSRTTSDTWAWSDSSSESGSSGILWGYRRTTADSWAWSDAVTLYRRAITDSVVTAAGPNCALSGSQNLSGATTITVDSTTGFDSSGTAYIIDNTTSNQQQGVFTYTGKTGTTFTGCSFTSLIGSTTFASGNSKVGAPNAESHFPQVVALDDTSAPPILVSYHQHGGHSVLRGSLKFKITYDGGITWGSEQTLIASPHNGSSFGIFGHILRRLKNGRLLAFWYEHEMDYTVADSIATWYTMSSYSDDNGSTWSTPVEYDTPYTYGTRAGTTGTGSGMLVYTGSGSNATYGDVYVMVFGNDDGIFVHSSPETYRTYPKLMKITDGGGTGSWSTVSTMGTTSDFGGRAASEGDLCVMESGTWVAHIRVENKDSGETSPYYPYYQRWQMTSTDQGATWTGHTRVNPLGNSGKIFKLPGGALISVGQDLYTSLLYTGATSYISYNNGATWTRNKVETTDGSYVAYNGSDGEVVIDDVLVSRNTIFAWADETTAQAGARTVFRWFIDPSRTYDAWAWSDAAAGVKAFSRTTSDTWAWSDAATGVRAVARTTDDTWAWHDIVTTGAGGIFARTTSDTWAWSDVASQSTSGAAARTTADTWAWSDSLARTLAAPRTTSDLWLWTEPRANPGNPLFWLMARARRRTMSAPTKTYKVVQPKGTTKTATWTSETYVAQTEAGILVVLDVTAASGTGGLTLRINAHDQASSQAVPLNAAPTAVTATGTTSYALYPFGAVAGNVTQATEFYLPRMFSITVTHGDSSSYTYSLGYCLLP